MTSLSIWLTCVISHQAGKTNSGLRHATHSLSQLGMLLKAATSSVPIVSRMSFCAVRLAHQRRIQPTTLEPSRTSRWWSCQQETGRPYCVWGEAQGVCSCVHACLYICLLSYITMCPVWFGLVTLFNRKPSHTQAILEVKTIQSDFLSFMRSLAVYNCDSVDFTLLCAGTKRSVASVALMQLHTWHFSATSSFSWLQCVYSR